MQLTTFLAAASTLAIGANAGVIPRDGARLGQFRIFGAAGCYEKNGGFYTVDESDAGTCKSFTGSAEPIVSLELEALYSPAADGCSLSIYTDENCSVGQRSLSVNVCNDAVAAGESWGSWKISCSA